MKSVSSLAAELADREAIRHCLAQYCRGIDRRDFDLVEETFWPDATDDHAVLPPMSAQEFVSMLRQDPDPPSMELTQHMLGNILIDIVGTAAYVETYLFTYHRCVRDDGARFDLLAGARFLDRMEKRDDEWRVARRVLSLDWIREYDDTADLDKGFRGIPFIPGGHRPDDASYALLRPSG